MTLRAGSSGYPALLRELLDAPETLYVLGRLPAAAPALAVVGSRRPTPYGRRTARRLAGEAARAGIAVVSGLARGIDAEAHRGALEAGGITWAVLGSGLDRVYPPENAPLAEEIVRAGGAVLSEFPPGTAPLAVHFPRRNRIVSGLAWGVVVVEGDLKSGTLITAGLAARQGREVFAVPGPAGSPLSAGPHRLLRDGARLVESIEDVLEELPVLRGSPPAALGGPIEPQGQAGKEPSISPAEEKILELLGSEALSLEELLRETAWDLPRLVGVLARMEARGAISPTHGQRYARV